MIVSGGLSRVHMKDVTSEIPRSEMKLCIDSKVLNLPVSDQWRQQLQSKTGKDSTLQLLENYALLGLPSTVNKSVIHFYSVLGMKYHT